MMLSKAESLFFLDYAIWVRASDGISYEVLLKKSAGYGVALDTVETYLSNRQQLVSVSDAESEV